VVFSQRRIAQTAFLSKDFDLQFDQLKHLTSDSGGWIRHHQKFLNEIVAASRRSCQLAKRLFKGNLEKLWVQRVRSRARPILRATKSREQLCVTCTR